MLKSVNHIGIAVKDIERAIEDFRKIFGFNIIHRENVEHQKVTIASFNVGDVKVELTAPTSDKSPISKFLDKRGEGIHHIAFETDNLDNELTRMKKEDIKLINEYPTEGAHGMLISFLHPKSTHGVLTEFCQPNKDKENH